jgi:hypothetical protein
VKSLRSCRCSSGSSVQSRRPKRSSAEREWSPAADHESDTAEEPGGNSRESPESGSRTGRHDKLRCFDMNRTASAKKSSKANGASTSRAAAPFVVGFEVRRLREDRREHQSGAAEGVPRPPRRRQRVCCASWTTPARITCIRWTTSSRSRRRRGCFSWWMIWGKPHAPLRRASGSRLNFVA